MSATALTRAPAATSQGSYRLRAVSGATGRIVVLSIIAAYFVVPIVWLVVASTKTRGQLTTTPPFAIVDSHLWQNLTQLVSYDGGIFGQWALNSALYAVTSAAVGTLIAVMAGYYLSLFPFRGSRFLFALVLGGVLVPTTALSLPLFLLVAQVHLTDTFWAVFLPSIVNPLGFYLARVSTDAAVPREIVEAARIDGAGEFRIFFSVGMRLLSPSIVTIFLLIFVGVWNNFLLPLLMLQTESKYPLTLGLYAWSGQEVQAPGLQTLVLIGSLVSVVPLMIAFLSLQRFWRNGIAAGGVKI